LARGDGFCGCRCRELAKRFGIEHELVAPGSQKILLAKLCQRQADGFASHANRLGELFVGDAKHHAVVTLRRGSRAAEAQQGVDQALIAIFEPSRDASSAVESSLSAS